MSDQYPRVAADVRVGWWGPTLDPSKATHKVVPADAIVIERGDLPFVSDGGAVPYTIRAGDQYASPHEDPAILRERAAEYVALAEHLAAHPPVDPAQVAEMDRDLDQVIGDVGHNSPELAARLVALGWTKPEPKP